jgi:hypothetical protein
MEMTDERIHRSKELKELLPDNVIVEIPPLTTIKEQEQVTRRARLRWAAVTAVFGSVVMAFAATYLRG